MKKFTLIILIIFVTNIVSSQNFDWVIKAGGTSSDIGEDCATDGTGNVYITGSITGTANFGNFSAISKGGEDIYLAKFDSKGNCIWLKSFGSTGEDKGFAVSVNLLSDKIYVTGWFSGQVTFGNTTLTSKGSTDVFIAGFESNGDLMWVKQGGGTSFDRGIGIYFDKNGDVAVTGHYGGLADFDSQTLRSIGSVDVFVAKYKRNDGSFVGANSLGGQADDYGYGAGIDIIDNIYVTGYMNGSNGHDIFLMKYDSKFNQKWYKQIGGSGNDAAYGLKVDSKGNCYLSGWYQNSITFGNVTLNSKGAHDAFIAKIDSSGNVLWAKSVGGYSEDLSVAITIDFIGNSYMVGSFDVSATFENVNLTSKGGHDIFVAKYDPNGNFVSVKQSGGNGTDDGRGICFTPEGYIYVTGWFSSTVAFDNTNLTSSGNIDIFIAKLPTNITDVKEVVEYKDNSLKIYPNPANTYFVINSETKDEVLNIYNNQGQLMKSIKLNQKENIINISEFSKGLYFVEKVNQQGRKFSKIVKE